MVEAASLVSALAAFFFAAAVAFFAVAACLVRVGPAEAVVVSGRRPRVLGPGLHWVWPVVEAAERVSLESIPVYVRSGGVRARAIVRVVSLEAFAGLDEDDIAAIAARPLEAALVRALTQTDDPARLAEIVSRSASLPGLDLERIEI